MLIHIHSRGYDYDCFQSEIVGLNRRACNFVILEHVIDNNILEKKTLKHKQNKKTSFQYLHWFDIIIFCQPTGYIVTTKDKYNIYSIILVRFLLKTRLVLDSRWWSWFLQFIIFAKS